MWRTSVWPLVVVSVLATGFSGSFLGSGLVGLMAGAYLARRFAKRPVFTFGAAFSMALLPLAVLLAVGAGLAGYGSVFGFIPDLIGYAPGFRVLVATRITAHTVVMTPILAAT
jgi:hypothetical protein